MNYAHTQFVNELASRWEGWDDLPSEERDAIIRHAAAAARTAFMAGVDYGRKLGGEVYTEAHRLLDHLYPIPVQYREVVGTNGVCWQVRDGWTWTLERDRYVRHLPVTDVLAALVRLEHYADLQRLAELAANPTK